MPRTGFTTSLAGSAANSPSGPDAQPGQQVRQFRAAQHADRVRGENLLGLARGDDGYRARCPRPGGELRGEQPLGDPGLQAAPHPVTASTIFRARAVSPPKYRAARAPIAQAPGRSSSTRGQNSSTAATTCPNARASASWLDWGQSGHHSTGTRTGPVALTRRLVCPAPRRLARRSRLA